MVRDMTQGHVTGQILRFAFPLLIGTVFQQFYNMVDAIIVGHYVGVNGLGAVGLTGPMTFLILGLVFGTCAGFAIPLAQDFGAHREDLMRRDIAHIILLGTTMAIIMTVIPVLSISDLLRLIQTPEVLWQDAWDYVFWILIGTAPMMLYNLLAAILRAVGDSRSPLLFLILSSLLNVALDLFFVKSLALGTRGAALATVLSQTISALLCLFYMIRRFPMLRITREDLVYDRRTAVRLLKTGLPMGLQYSITAIGGVILQTAVNGQGTLVVSAIAASGKIQNLIFSPMDALGVTAANFAGQNLGAGKITRIREGVRKTFLLLTLWSLMGFLIAWKGSGLIATWFVDASETEVIALICRYLFVINLFDFFAVMIFTFRNTLQGVGFSRQAMLGGAAELIIRTAFGLWIVPNGGFDSVCLANPIAWVGAAIVLTVLYIRFIPKLASSSQALNI